MGGSHVMCLPRLGQHVYVMIACGGCIARCMNICMSVYFDPLQNSGDPVPGIGTTLTAVTENVLWLMDCD